MSLKTQTFTLAVLRPPCTIYITDIVRYASKDSVTVRFGDCITGAGGAYDEIRMLAADCREVGSIGESWTDWNTAYTSDRVSTACVCNRMLIDEL